MEWYCQTAHVLTASIELFVVHCWISRTADGLSLLLLWFLVPVDHNVVVRQAKLHNDASCDIAQDGSLLCTFIQSSRSSCPGSGDVSVTLGIFSLNPATRGQCLFRKSFGNNSVFEIFRCFSAANAVNRSVVRLLLIITISERSDWISPHHWAYCECVAPCP